MASQPYDLQRFLDAQQHVYATALNELQNGRKQSHWMWYVFPQIQGLGTSATSRKYAISSRSEAVAYAAHDTLGPRLQACTRATLAIENRSAFEIFSTPDDLKFHSSMTLFAEVDQTGLYRHALVRFFEGRRDPATLAILDREPDPSPHFSQGHGSARRPNA